MIGTRNIVIAHDLAMVVLAWCLALAARFNFEIPPWPFLVSGFKALPVVLFVQALMLWRFGLYRGLWRFASLQDLWNIIRSAVLGAVFVTLALFFVMRLADIPRSVLILYPVFLLLLLGAPRLAYRLFKDRTLGFESLRSGVGTRVIVVGAGEAGETLVRDMRRDPAWIAVGLVDDRRELARRRIHGVPVLGTIDELPALVARYRADLVIIAIPSASNLEMQRIVDVCERAGCPFRTLPRLHDIVSGRLGIREIRQVAIDDLLGRSAVELDWPAIQTKLSSKIVLVTGGAGSIGSELCRQVARLGVRRLVVYEQSEHGLYELEREMRRGYPHLEISCVLGDVCDAAAVANLFAVERPQVVFHAAAYKHVPIVERQVREGIRNNVVGTRVVAEAAQRFQAERMVLISTDKAVSPSSVMGATKRVAELICEAANQQEGTRYITVRFGNVLGSAGSVVPLFQEQIATGGPVTVTHPEATRYFMTIPEASQLILQAAALGSGGEIFVLEMGEPVNIAYLAEQMIRLSGHTPHDDIRIVYTGLRPGEKLREELFHGDEQLVPTAHGKVRRAVHAPTDSARVADIVAKLEDACERFDSREHLALLLRQAVPGFVSPSAEPAEPVPAVPSTVLPFRRGHT
ncbi:MAG: polysaccharide biosynthesis protein [Gammaproteobacteria bacterium]